MPQQGAAAGPDKVYADMLAAGQFRIQHCQDCKQHVFFPRNICPHCGGDALDWTEPKGTGTVYSTSVIRRKPEAGGDYNIVLVDLDEGVRLMSRVEGIAPASVCIGMRVKARVAPGKAEGEPALVVFDPVEGQAK
ncbi:OB-fold domain-containing protein [Cupriavidus sp. WKF15]|uniref:Zn-ribbon domain-containing OB-fold protein n=1 Tax=Cupriavidus sp. WKF15 TaxID=3032282 RepID=UPI0023E0A107|nr:OB-fold domain-containing protein [Cupriavidus sp. WKF15]WER50021.1 OB-fold domain-containing protein [Cupriavidus sp. WKF15]